jgi:hypothetical protein
MLMGKIVTCDVCGKPTSKIVAKLYLAPTKGERGLIAAVGSDYTASMDVGVCCTESIPKIGKWTKRKKRNGNSVAAS